MKEFRIHGRGGQGSVVTAELLAIAAFKDGNYCQAFPYLGGGGERRGAPVQSFVRTDAKPVLPRNMIHEPDYVIVMDMSIAKVVDVTSGLKKGGMILVNSERQDLDFGPDYRVNAVPATSIALEEIGRPVINTAMIGAFAAFSGEFSKDALAQAIREKFDGPTAEKNVRAMTRAYEYARSQCEDKGMTS